MRALILCDDGDPESVLPLARNENLGIEMQSFYHPRLLDDPDEALSRHRRLLQGFSGTRSVHGPFGDLCPGSFDPMIRQVTAHRIKQILPIVEELEARHLVLHHGYVPNTSPPPNWTDRSYEFWYQILDQLPDGVYLHLENLLDRGPDMLLELIARLDDPRVGICLDIGHAHALSPLAVLDWVQAAADRIGYVHLHDNRGKKDEHLPLGQGNLPMREVLAALEQHAPDAVWAIEAAGVPSLAWLKGSGFVVEP